ncbi:hypothetical protein Lal_00033863 [Lupinus albus]|nr:hypothetical protein Lal_00033863 [Lupinus albus]
MGFQENKRVRIESFTSSQALEQESKLLDLGNALFSHLSSILNLKMYLGFLSFNALVRFSLKRAYSRSTEKIPSIFKNSDLTLSLKRESHSLNSPKMPFLAQARQLSLRRESSSIAQDFTLPECLEIQLIANDITTKYVPPHVNIYYCLGGITLTCFLVQVET